VASKFDAPASRHCVTRDFGALRVLNAEWLAPGGSIPLHSHENMEVLTLVQSGAVRHEDSRGQSQVIAPGEIHLLSAGIGMTHREFNHSLEIPAHYLQAWITPKSTRTPTRYGHAVVSTANISGRFFLAAGPPGSGSAVEINQDAYVSLIRLERDVSATYTKYAQGNALYFLLLEGRLQAGSELLEQGKGFAATSTPAPACTALDVSTLLCIEVPLQHYQV
jgi:quercetin 2,3-dioxygenase